MNELPILEQQVHPFDARGVAKRFRHASIFGALESLRDGEVMRFINDHDPVPLLDQIRQRYGAQVGIEYLSREPGAIVIDFSIRLAAAEAAAPAESGCGGGGGGCGCAGH